LRSDHDQTFLSSAVLISLGIRYHRQTNCDCVTTVALQLKPG
jgi:hypothetical protein